MKKQAIKNYLQALRDDLVDIQQDLDFFTQLKNMYKVTRYDELIGQLTTQKKHTIHKLTYHIRRNSSATDILKAKGRI